MAASALDLFAAEAAEYSGPNMFAHQHLLGHRPLMSSTPSAEPTPFDAAVDDNSARNSTSPRTSPALSAAPSRRKRGRPFGSRRSRSMDIADRLGSVSPPSARGDSSRESKDDSTLHRTRRTKTNRARRGSRPTILKPLAASTASATMRQGGMVVEASRMIARTRADMVEPERQRKMPRPNRLDLHSNAVSMVVPAAPGYPPGPKVPPTPAPGAYKEPPRLAHSQRQSALPAFLSAFGDPPAAQPQVNYAAAGPSPNEMALLRLLQGHAAPPLPAAQTQPFQPVGEARDEMAMITRRLARAGIGGAIHPSAPLNPDDPMSARLTWAQNLALAQQHARQAALTYAIADSAHRQHMRSQVRVRLQEGQALDMVQGAPLSGPSSQLQQHAFVLIQPAETVLMSKGELAEGLVHLTNVAPFPVVIAVEVEQPPAGIPCPVPAPANGIIAPGHAMTVVVRCPASSLGSMDAYRGIRVHAWRSSREAPSPTHLFVLGDPQQFTLMLRRVDTRDALIVA